MMLSEMERTFTNKLTGKFSGLYPLRRNFMDRRAAYHLTKKSGNFGLKSNGKVIFRKFRSEIVEYLRRYSSFGTERRKFPYHLVNFPVSSLSSAGNNHEKSNCKWLASSRLGGLLILEKSLPLLNGHPNRFILTNDKHPRN